MPRMQLIPIYSMNPRGYRTCERLNIQMSVWLMVRTTRRDCQGHGRQVSTLPIGAVLIHLCQFPVCDTACQAALYGNEVNLSDE